MREWKGEYYCSCCGERSEQEKVCCEVNMEFIRYDDHDD